MLDPFVALGAAAAVTERIKLGTGIVPGHRARPDRHGQGGGDARRPVSGGRVLFGVGAGWNLEEMRNHGTDPRQRFGIMRERVEAMKAIWTQDEAEYHGKHVDFDPIWAWPKPVQKPHPPVLVGGMGEKALDRVSPRRRVDAEPGGSPEVLGGRIDRPQRARARPAASASRCRLFAAKPEARAVERLRGVGVDRVDSSTCPTEDADEPSAGSTTARGASSRRLRWAGSTSST